MWYSENENTETRNRGNDFRESANPRINNNEEMEQVDSFPPNIPDGFYKNLPYPLDAIAELASTRSERDIQLLGTITCLSAAFDNVSAIYDCRKVFPNLFLFLSAPAGVGKGPLNFSREIVMPLHRQLRDKAEMEEVMYRNACKEQLKKSDAKFVEEPRMSMFFIPANSSAASFQKILVDNNGVGLIFESEGDTLSQALKRDYGQFSDILRKAFHHEPVTLSRKTNREYIEIAEPKLSVVLAGTPSQVLNLIPSAENGLMSRFMFYILPFSLETRNVFDTAGEAKLTKFTCIAKQVCEQIEQFKKQGPCHFRIRRDNEEIYMELLKQIAKDCTDINKNLLGTARRMGLIGFRIMMLLTILRELKEHKIDEQPFDGKAFELVCNEEDFLRTIMLMNVLIKHSVYMFLSSYGKANEPRFMRDRRETIFAQMPDSFTTHDYNLIVERNGYNVRTAEIWLRKFIDEGRLKRTCQGVYEKKPP